jgi:hypothetical protein
MTTSRPPPRHPRGLRRAVLAGVVAGLLASLLAAPTAAAAPPGSAGPPVPRLRWAPCSDGLEWTSAQVPLDYDRPSGATITLALIRLPASDPARRIGEVWRRRRPPGDARCSRPRCERGSSWSASTRAASAPAPRCAASTRGPALGVLRPFR